MTEATAPDSQPGSVPQAQPPGEPPRLPSDDRLTLQATRGDRRAFEAIYQRYHRDLYRFCLAMAGNPQDAQDALQNTMVKVLRALPGEKRHIQLKPWLYRIARNEAVETVRRRRDSVELEPEHAVSMEGVAETAETRERLRRLIADLEELPDRQRAALVMRELAGLGFEQIGEAFETSAAVARQTIYEARLSLHQMEEGREMSCDRVMRELSDADGRVTRRREVRAHLRACPSCRAFRDSMATRRGELAAIAPLPLAVSAGLLHGILSGKASAAGLSGSAAGAAGGSGAGGLAGTVGAGAGKAVATSAILKAAATVAVVAVVGAGAADRSGLIHVPLLGGSGRAGQSSSRPAGSGGSAGGAATQQGESASENGGGGKGAASGKGAKAGGPRHVASAGHGTAGASGHAASGRAHSHGRGRAGAGAGSKGSSASAHGKATATAHRHATHKSQSSSSASQGALHSRRSSHRHRASHRHRSPPRHPHHSSAATAPTKPPPPPPPPPKKESAPNPPPTSGDTPNAGASSATEPPAGG